MRALLGGLVLLLAGGFTAAGPGTAAAAVAAPALRVTSDARYDVQPSRDRIHVTVDAVATSYRRDTTTRRYSFSNVTLSLPARAENLRATSGSARLATRQVSRTKDFALIEIAFSRRVYYGKPYAFRLTFDLIDRGGVPTRELRVGTALVSFAIWAYATESTPGSTVSVVVPYGYQARAVTGRFTSKHQATNGATIFRSGELSAPLRFFAYVVAERPGAFSEYPIAVTAGGGPARAVLRAWNDDPIWATQTSRLLRRGIPVLGDLIGQPLRGEEPLIVEETTARAIGGSAALYDAAERRLLVTFAASAPAILEQAAHAWFNGGLVADRWLAEGFAAYYAAQAARQLKLRPISRPLTRSLLARRIPLNGWSPPAQGLAERSVDRFARAASARVVELVAKQAGPGGLRALMTSLAARVGASDGSTSSSGPREPADWRVVLDLLETGAGSGYEAIWREWVARPADIILLDGRKAAREDHAELLLKATGWRLPAAIQDALDAWDFARAGALMVEAGRALDQRRAVEAAVSGARLTLPPIVRSTFERDDAFASFGTAAAGAIRAAGEIGAAELARGRPSGPVESVGLLGTDPIANLDAAKVAFGAGNFEASIADAQAARAAWEAAPATGQGRVLLGFAGSFAALTAVLAGLSIRRRRIRAAEVNLGPALRRASPVSSRALALGEVPPAVGSARRRVQTAPGWRGTPLGRRSTLPATRPPAGGRQPG